MVPLLPYLLRFQFNDGSSIDLAGCESWQPHLHVHLQIQLLDGSLEMICLPPGLGSCAI